MAKVLTVDDSKVVRTMAAKHLQPYGCRVLEADNGRDGLATAQRELPDLILLDISMPGMDGRQTLAAIRTDDRTKGIPVIMLADEATRDRVREVTPLGVRGCIVKPFSREGFEREVVKVLGAAPAAAPRVPEPPRAAVAVDPHRVLVIDDSERVLEAARTALGPSLQVATATRGAEGVARWREGQAGVVVIDLVMPELDGCETLAMLRAAGGQKAYAVGLIVRGDEAARQRVRKAGFAAIVDKPLVAGELCREVSLGVATVGAGEVVVFEEQGCPVLVCPDPQALIFPQFVPAAERTLKTLAEDGRDQLILDLGAVTHANANLVKTLIGFMRTAAAMGMRTAVCASAPVAEHLRRQGEAQGMGACVPTRTAARELLGVGGEVRGRTDGTSQHIR